MMMVTRNKQHLKQLKALLVKKRVLDLPNTSGVPFL